ncbi:MAG: hypothetical protein ABJO28_06335 [Maribacter dokdonensis]|jgi:cbb3-type cytochrome oxidase subunit 3|uniref:Uncharacterized protein n=2 Tax=Maribacter TaxID=252356 RepID=A0A1H4JZG9_9FLAO|nr:MULTISPECIES: hypothetical protein [Maribacter]HAI37226.1 hypothetical protein [Maribacter sp.]APA63843.1 membrane protein [Maribacter sp. 1_2014MBL_MicDiv]KSA13343.1 hypothetical protein I600_2780 [Maribacter dokdonensis DSW-8]MBU2901082.1 hypothetical protein [Maribacter dokdonensis]MDP2526285.1 hypothetical protein [Maribacter dokdonensis]|tara:strand:- start:428 stop:634 length:207 start_codon:yes stop_codon:yes gene_type:complete
MINILRYTEYLYVIVAGFSIYRIITDWNTDRSMAYFFIFFAVISIGMFLFRRNYRKKFEQRKRDNQNK